MKQMILVIDDDAEILEVLQMGLEYSGFSVEIAINTDVAGKLLAERKIGLVICDLTLSNENGIEFLKRMKASLEFVPPFIISSGFPMDKSQFQDMEIVGFISKPFTIPELTKLVNSILM